MREDLPEDTHWPVCMRVFARLGELEPMVREVGFEDVVIDMSDRCEHSVWVWVGLWVQVALLFHDCHQRYQLGSISCRTL